METLTVQNEAMTHQQGLNEVLMRKVNRMLENKATSVGQTFEKMEREGKLMQDYITPIGVNLKSADRRPVVTFSANGAVNITSRFTTMPLANWLPKWESPRATLKTSPLVRNGSAGLPHESSTSIARIRSVAVCLCVVWAMR